MTACTTCGRRSSAGVCHTCTAVKRSIEGAGPGMVLGGAEWGRARWMVDQLRRFYLKNDGDGRRIIDELDGMLEADHAGRNGAVLAPAQRERVLCTLDYVANRCASDGEARSAIDSILPLFGRSRPPMVPAGDAPR